MANLATELLIASNNQHKVTEIRKMTPPGFIFYTLDDKNFTLELPETSGTISGNALQKARFVWNNTKLNCLSDDSGLCVTALDGKPGVDSAFYAGLPRNDNANIALLLKKLEGKSERKAEFLTVMALIINGQELIFEGRVEGTISDKPMGNSGFGYDPIFIPKGYDLTFAQMGEEEKNKISHRKNALNKVIAFLIKFGDKQLI